MTTPPEPGARKFAVAAIGAAIALFGAAAAAGWLLGIPALLLVASGLTPMARNTALCFALSGSWVVVAALRPTWRRTAGSLAAVLLVLAAAGMLQYPLGADFGIDAAELHRWLRATDLHPGRMSAFSSIAFVLAGVAMLLALRPPTPWGDALAALSASGTGIVGIAGLLGHMLQLHLIYAGYLFGIAALPTSVGLVALSVALWLHLVRGRRVRFWSGLPVHDRITFASAAILMLVSLAAGVSVLATMQARVHQALSDGLAMSLRHRVSLARELIDAGMQRSRILVGRPAPARALRRLKEHPNDAEAIALMSQSAASLVADGYLAASYFDTDGREIVTAGRPLRDSALSVSLGGASGATLEWREGFSISGRYAIADADGPVGTVLVEVPLPGLDALLSDQYRLGESGETGMCARFGVKLGCFPQPRNPKVYFTPATGTDGEPLPMARALAGGTGVALTRDYREVHVMAAYAPVGDFGLAMVVKADAAEIYMPIRERLQLALPILAALVVAGAFLVRAGVRPLATRLAQSEREAKERHRALESTMASVAEGIMLLDADGTIRSCNAAAARLFGYSAEDLVGRNVSMLIADELRAANIAATQEFLATGESKVLGTPDQNCPARRKDGSRFELGFTLTATGGVEKPQLVAVLRDVTERKEAEKRLMRLALHDALTGLPNRASFEQRIESALARCRRSGKPLALILVDLDNFKPVNDTLGHEVGDRLLVAFAVGLRGALRESDLLARLGGDEFTIVAEDLKGAEDAVAIAAKTLASLSDPLDVGGRTIRVSASIGIAVYREGDTPQTLMRRADQALYEAKGAGRARYRLAA